MSKSSKLKRRRLNTSSSVRQEQGFIREEVKKSNDRSDNEIESDKDRVQEVESKKCENLNHEQRKVATLRVSPLIARPSDILGMNLVTSTHVTRKHDLASISHFPDTPNNLRVSSLHPKIDVVNNQFYSTSQPTSAGVRINGVSQSINTINNSIQKRSSNSYFMGDGVRIPLQLTSFPDYKISYERSPVREKTSEYDCNVSSKNCTTTCSPRINLKTIVPQTGKLRVISSNGATIRTLFKIDDAMNSTSIGNLKKGSVREFVQAQWLSPPLCIDSDEEECVGVFRYQIQLLPQDIAHNLKWNVKQHLGWISDRGRLADDPYIITELL